MNKNFKTKNILVIDDDENSRYLVTELLKDSKCTVMTAKSGFEGLAKYINNKIDLVLLDINMPDMDGFETLLKLKEIDRNAEVIMCTSNIEYYQKVYDAGAIAYVTKPIISETLLNIIDVVFKLQKVA
jgi:CheY-like chemotaxis protein